MKILLSLLVCLLVVLAPFTVVIELSADATGLPWKTFSESAKDTITARPGVCSDGEVVIKAQLEHGGVTFMYFATESGRFVFAKLGADNMPVVIYQGQSLPSPRHDEINVLDEHQYSEDRDGSSPCHYLFPQRT